MKTFLRNFFAPLLRAYGGESAISYPKLPGTHAPLHPENSEPSDKERGTDSWMRKPVPSILPRCAHPHLSDREGADKTMPATMPLLDGHGAIPRNQEHLNTEPVLGQIRGSADKSNDPAKVSQMKSAPSQGMRAVLQRFFESPSRTSWEDVTLFAKSQSWKYASALEPIDCSTLDYGRLMEGLSYFESACADLGKAHLYFLQITSVSAEETTQLERLIELADILHGRLVLKAANSVASKEL